MDRYFGVDYYPEHWPRERWETDAKLMQEMGIGIVRMAEFAWAKLEPQENEFDFAWLDDAISLLSSYGIQTVLGTPSAAPPAWLVNAYPEALPMDRFGIRQSFGGRHHCCQSSQDYRARINIIVTKMAEHYGQNANVIGWQTDNELGNSHDGLCLCPSCTSAFHNWLKAKYQTIDALNQAWGTVFWSQTYADFSQIPSPKLNVTTHNPALLLDWRRFCSDLIVDFQHDQIKILRTHCKGQFITHNMMGYADKVDYFDLARDLDFSSQDQYPGFQEDGATYRDMANLSSALDLIRATKGRTFWVMEQQAGPAGWECISRTPAPGELRLWTSHSIAHGADTIIWFRWRTCTVGTEQYWHGILPHNGIPGRRYMELKQTANELTPIMRNIQGMGSGAEAAILYSYDENSTMKIQPCHPKLDYKEIVQGFYGGLYRKNVMVDFIAQSAAFSQYRLIIAPLLTLTTPELCKQLADYVSNGGTLVLTMRTSTRDMTGRCYEDGHLPVGLSGLCGLTVEDYTTLSSSTPFTWKTSGEDNSKAGSGHLFCDVITPNGCESLADYTSDYFADSPAITQNKFGNGQVFYIGTVLDDSDMDILATHLINASGVQSLGITPSEVELCARQDDQNSYLFAMNHSSQPKAFAPPEGSEPLLPIDGADDLLPPYGVQVYHTCKK